MEVLLVHRPLYGDWSLPKGKCDGDEGDLECALREVEEETGLRCEAGAELAPSHYTDSKGRPKVVRWWAMTSRDEAVPDNEVDEVRWCPVAAAAQALSYDRDREVLAELLGLL